MTLGLLAAGGNRAEHPPNRLLAYVITMAAEWLIVAFIALGARSSGVSLRVLAGEFSPTWRSILRDLGLAIAYLIVANPMLQVLGIALGRLMRSAPNEAMKNILPHTGAEDAAFLLLALTAGICEELIFRGYLRLQCTAWTGNAAAGIALQGIAFGASHAYQGTIPMIVIAIYGCMFGWLAYWRKSLRPGMAAHFIQDGVGGLLLARFVVK
jgi:membrane protease YdiL (CAAX protease family)